MDIESSLNRPSIMLLHAVCVCSLIVHRALPAVLESMKNPIPTRGTSIEKIYTHCKKYFPSIRKTRYQEAGTNHEEQNQISKSLSHLIINK